MSYGDYVEQLTYLLFLKMADERSPMVESVVTGHCLMPTAQRFLKLRWSSIYSPPPLEQVEGRRGSFLHSVFRFLHGKRWHKPFSNMRGITL